MHIGAHFDSGNIEVLDASDPGAVRLAIRTDSNAAFYLRLGREALPTLAHRLEKTAVRRCCVWTWDTSIRDANQK